MVVEGLENDVDEFVHRIKVSLVCRRTGQERKGKRVLNFRCKALQWYALQLRYEQTDAKPIEGSEQDALQNCKLARVIEVSSDKRSKVASLEVHSMSDLSSL